MKKILFVSGIVFLVSPLLIYGAIVLKGDIILTWPFPFSHLGGAPFQTLVDILLFLIGLALIIISKLLKSKNQ